MTKLLDSPEYNWVLHKNYLHNDESFKDLAKKKYLMVVLGGLEDPAASYSFDMFCIVKLQNQFYVFSTAGCSCPSPEENCVLEFGPGSLADVKKHFVDGNYSGYTLPKEHLEYIINLVDNELKNSLPLP